MKSSKQEYFIKIRLFSRIFFKNRFHSFIRNLLQDAVIKICIFSKNLVRVKALAYVIRIIPAQTLFFKIVFASIISCFKMRETRSIKTSKAKEVVGNNKKVILRNVLETTWNDNDCSLNIVIGPKVEAFNDRNEWNFLCHIPVRSLLERPSRHQNQPVWIFYFQQPTE